MREEAVPDAELLARAVDRDESAWAMLVRRYDGLVREVARRCGLGHGDVADVSQTTWMRLVEHASRIREPERLAGWLKTTSHNEAVAVITRDAKRREREAARLADPTHHRAEVDLDAGLVADERAAAVHAGLAALPEGRRRLVTLVVNDVPYAEITRITGMPPGSIGPTWGRSLRYLHRLPEIGRLEREARHPTAHGLREPRPTAVSSRDVASRRELAPAGNTSPPYDPLPSWS